MRRRYRKLDAYDKRALCEMGCVKTLATMIVQSDIGKIRLCDACFAEDQALDEKYHDRDSDGGRDDSGGHGRGRRR